MKVSRFIACLLAVLLVIGQHAALAHGVTHLAVLAGGDDPSLPHFKVCDQCNQASNLSAGLAAQTLMVITPVCMDILCAAWQSPPATRTPLFYCARAPPRLS